MQMCPDCGEVYDPTEYSKCPQCSDDLKEEHGERYFKTCPNCGSTMYWDGLWECTNCGEEISTSEDDNDGIIEY